MGDVGIAVGKGLRDGIDGKGGVVMHRIWTNSDLGRGECWHGYDWYSHSHTQRERVFLYL
jgi:hypothetical protein